MTDLFNQEEKTEVAKYKFEPIKGYPMLHWQGKRPFTGTQFYPAQLKEKYGEDKDSWINKIFWGDNLQVMSHMLKEYRGKVKLIYIDPPFDSKADYKKKINLKGKEVLNDNNSFEEKQYTDIWTNDEYLQFMYERLVLLRELLADDGVVMLHCDWHKVHHLRCLLDEIFGHNMFINEIIWSYRDIGSRATNYFKRKHDNLLIYSKSNEWTHNIIRGPISESTKKRYEPYFDEYGKITYSSLKKSNPGVFAKLKGIPEDLNDVWLDSNEGAQLTDCWSDISPLKNGFEESTAYPTQKPEGLIERLIFSFSNPGDIVFDCFMGSGTTQAVAMKLGRKFLGADINLGAIQTTTKRLLNIKEEIESNNSNLFENEKKYTSFEVYNVNHYDFFRNELEAKELLLEALEIQKFEKNIIFDGEKDGRLVKIMPVNRITTRAELSPIISNLDYKKYHQKQDENPNKPVEKITLVCMGHEPDLKAVLENELKPLVFDIEIVDILRDKADLQFKRESEAEIVIENGYLKIENFYPMNLLQKLGYQKKTVEDWKELVESIFIDWNYDGAILEPSVLDIPDKNQMVEGVYKIPEGAGTIKIKITDLLSESLELEVSNG